VCGKQLLALPLRNLQGTRSAQRFSRMHVRQHILLSVQPPCQLRCLLQLAYSCHSVRMALLWRLDQGGALIPRATDDMLPAAVAAVDLPGVSSILTWAQAASSCTGSWKFQACASCDLSPVHTARFTCNHEHTSTAYIERCLQM
jgi:hypothetical protein